jgi:alkylhydroperoxidase family enzyme
VKANFASTWPACGTRWDCCGDPERAAFAWAESVTKVSETHVPDEAFAQAHRHFSDEELAKLTLAIVTVNGWNRFCISLSSAPGRYQPSPSERKTSAA